MIVSHAQKFIFLSIPRTASTSLRQWLMDSPELDCERDARNPHSLSGGLYPDYHRWTVVRNPYDRAVSLWRYYRDFYPYGNAEMTEPLPLSFFQFAELQQVKHLMLSWWFYGVTQCEFLADEPVDTFIRFENLEADLSRLPFALPDRPLPRLESTEHEPWPEYLDRRSEALVWEWAKEDFERFGYSRIEVE